MNKINNKKVYVAMSGGVDSSVAALLLKNQGYDVTGVFMKYWMDSGANAPSFAEASAGKENRCCSLEARRDAMRVCAQLNIPFLTWDFQKEFKKAVVDDFISGYKTGITPNPCVVCNKEIKLGLFLKRAIKEGADFVATGHYTKNQKSKIKNQKYKSKFKIIYKLRQAKDKRKDQSYFLYNLTQGQLARILFPLGDLIKDEVRGIAKKAGLPVALKKDSQEVCFIKDGDLKKFLSEKIKTRKGDVVLNGGGKIGKHQGVEFYTVGQRAPVGGTGPYYVIAKNIKKNQLIVARGNDKNVLIREFAVKDVNWVSGRAPMPTGRQAKMPFECVVKTRYQQKAQKAVIKSRIKNRELRIKNKKLIRKAIIHNLKFAIQFKNPQRGVTPGQSAVFYLPAKAQRAKGGEGREIIGGGIIK